MMTDPSQVRRERLDRMHDIRDKRDITDAYLRRSVQALGYKGKHLSLRIADVLIHPNRPNESTLLLQDGERRVDAVSRLRVWAWEK